MEDAEALFHTELDRNVLVIEPLRPDAEILDSAAFDRDGDRLVRLINEHAEATVVFDMSAMRVANSLFFALLLRLWKRISQRNGVFAVVAKGEIRRMLDISQLSRLWTVYPSRSMALMALRPTERM